MIEPGPGLLSLRIWARREEKILAIVERALELLRTEQDLPHTECDLNRRFYFQLLRASRELNPSDPVAPIYECNNQPDPDDEARATREDKRPDFQWIYLDEYEPDPERMSRQFTIECKRLGRPDRSNWIFNVNYVKNGMCRFHDPEWGYGRRFASGAMVGYWQSMELLDVIDEVNAEAFRNGLPEIAAVGDALRNGYRSEHSFNRSFPSSPFRLRHVWIDLRSSKKAPLKKQSRKT